MPAPGLPSFVVTQIVRGERCRPTDAEVEAAFAEAIREGRARDRDDCGVVQITIVHPAGVPVSASLSPVASDSAPAGLPVDPVATRALADQLARDRLEAEQPTEAPRRVSPVIRNPSASGLFHAPVGNDRIKL